MKEFASAFYKGKQWQECRRGFIAYRISIDGGMCQRCCDKPGYIIHHKIELTPQNITDPDVALNWENLQYLCKACHDATHDVFQNKSRVTFDEDGNVLPRGGLPPSKIF